MSNDKYAAWRTFARSRGLADGEIDGAIAFASGGNKTVAALEGYGRSRRWPDALIKDAVAFATGQIDPATNARRPAPAPQPEPETSRVPPAPVRTEAMKWADDVRHILKHDPQAYWTVAASSPGADAELRASWSAAEADTAAATAAVQSAAPAIPQGGTDAGQ